MFKFIKTTMAGGLLFILPLVLIVWLIEKAIHLIKGPLTKLLPMFAEHSIAGITLFSLVALLTLVGICFIAGLLANTRFAIKLLRLLEEQVLGNLPGYQLLKDMTARMTGVEHLDGAKVGLICEDDGWLFCLVLEAGNADWVSVYIADAGPSGGTAGELRLMPAACVRMTELSWLSVLACLRRGGRGALELAGPWLPKSVTA